MAAPTVARCEAAAASPPQPPRPSGARRHPLVLFADIDGSLVHYPEDDELQEMERSGEVLILPPSTTGRRGVISRRTLELCAALRSEGGVRLAIVSGARTPTLLARLPFLPAADAYVSENGGRIFYPGGGGDCAGEEEEASCRLTACPLAEDLEWRRLLAPAAGPVHQEATPPERREGLVWDHYRTLAASGRGWRLDALGYSTAFRLQQQQQGPSGDGGGGGDGGREAAERAARDRPAGLKASFNLGVCDVYPEAAGKEGAARHLLARWGADAADAAHLCDDDNDLPLARMVGRAFLPRVAEQSVARAVEADPARFVVATERHAAATEQMLRAAAAFFEERRRKGATAATAVGSAAAAAVAAAPGDGEEGDDDGASSSLGQAGLQAAFA